MKIFATIIIIVVSVAIIASFFVIGSPQEQRLNKFDKRRVNDLQMIQSQLVNFWINKSVLPNMLKDLEDDISGFKVPVDPETGSEYDYSVKGNLTFELCATFNFETDEKGSPAIPSRAFPPITVENWEHEAGRNCFERTIDPDLYSKDLR